jgi:subtilisin family serine protease
MQSRSLKLAVLLICLSMLSMALIGQPVKADQVGAATSSIQHNLEVSKTGIYIVRLQDASLAAYPGGISRLAATSPQVTGASKLDTHTPESQAYLNYLGQKQGELLEIMTRTFGRPIDVVFQYKNVLNAVAVRIDHSEAVRVFNLPGVRTVYPDRINRLDTDIGPTLIGAPNIWIGDTESGLATKGEGIVIGVIDTGINHAHPSFADIGGDTYDHTNPNGEGIYFGYCVENPTFCNDKLIGAYDLTDGGSGGPEDEAGHGSHTASTAAGNSVDMELNGVPYTISGVAPHANLIAYRVCDDDGGCQTAATVAAVDHAIADGVSVINYSISGGDDPWNSAVDQAFLDAFDARIFVSASAGNAGPDPSTVAKTGPWNAAVAASTHGRNYLPANIDVWTATEEINGILAVEGTGPALTGELTAYILYGGDVDGTNVLGCNPWPAGSFTDKIGIVSRGTCSFVDKVNNLAAAGAIGALVYDNVDDALIIMAGLEGTTIPSMFISMTDGLAVVEMISGDNSAQATLRPSGLIYEPDTADIMADFSSRGPSQWELLKPDYTAPGVNVLAAVAAYGDQVERYAVYSGTSMAAPHGSGSAALLMALHPDWSPAEIKSAIATTANPELLKEDGLTPAIPFDMGSGRIDLAASAFAGIVLDETTENYIAANPYEGGEPNSLNQPSMVEYDCIGSCSWTRTLKSTLDYPLTWSISFVEPPGLDLNANISSSFQLAAGGTQTLVITADTSAGEVGKYYFGEVVLTPPVATGIATVRLPVVAMFEMSNLPAKVDILTDQLAGTKTIYGTQALIEIEELYPQVFGMVKGTPHDLLLDQDPTNGDAFDDLSQVFWTTITVPPQSKRLVAEVVASDALDVDLYLGSGSTPSEDTIECASATESWAEYCNIDEPKNGTWWVLVQNWQGSADQPDAIKAVTAVVGSVDAGNMTITGPVSVPAQELFDLDINWDEPSLQDGDMWYAQFNLGTRRSDAGNLGYTNVDLAYIGDFYAVEFTPATQDGYGDPGQVVDYILTLSNQGNLADTYDLSYPEGPWAVDLEVSSVALEPYSSQEFRVSVTVPQDALPDAMETVTVTATSQANPMMTAEAEINTYANSVFDFDLLPASAADHGTPGEVVTYTLTLTNVGNNEDTVSLTTADELWDVNLPVESFDLALGASFDVIVEVTIPADAVEGEMYMITITATSGAGVVKTSELTTTVAFERIWIPLILTSE